MKSHLAVSLSLFMLGAVNPVAAQVLFSDGFDTDTSSNWDVFEGSGNGVPDFTAEFGFDYGSQSYTENGEQKLIPPAPNSDGTTQGVKLTVNNTDDAAAGSAVSLYPKGESFSGNYALRFDMWMNYNGGAFGGSGSTEFATFGVNHVGDKVNWADGSFASDGNWFAVSGEGGSGRDYRAYVGDGVAPIELQGFDGGFLDRDGDGVPETNVSGDPSPLKAMFPEERFETAGAPGKEWVEVEVRFSQGVVTWLMNGYVIAEHFNTLDSSGNIMLGYMDIFSSIANPAEDNFVIYDNLRVVDLDAEPLPELGAINISVGEGSEPNEPASFLVFRSRDFSEDLTVRYVTVGSGLGVAAGGDDYETLSGEVTIPAGADSAIIEVVPIDDSDSEGNETVTLLLEPGSGYEVGEMALATVVLQDDETSPAVRIAARDGVAAEPGLNPGSIEIYRIGVGSEDLTVDFEVGGSAVNGEDYGLIQDSAIIFAGTTNTFIEITPHDDEEADGDKIVELTLTSSDTYNLGSKRSATVTIWDNDVVVTETLFSEDFESGDFSMWKVLSAVSTGPENDYTYTPGFDYSANLLLPSAPSSDGNADRGVFLQVNNTDEVRSQVAVNLYPEGQSFSGNYALRFDMWMNYNGGPGGGSGSTESVLTGINHSGENVNWLAGKNTSDGLWFSANGEGGSSSTSSLLRDYSSFVADSTGEAVRLSRGEAGLVAEDEGDAFALALFADHETPGAPGKDWVQVEVRQLNGEIYWLLDGHIMARRENQSGSTSGNIMVGYMDPFSSIAEPGEDNFLLIDNVRVVRLEGDTSELPEIEIQSIAMQDDGTLEIAFTATSGSASDFEVLGAAAVNGAYEAVAGGTVAGNGDGSFTASVPQVGAEQGFYQIGF